MKCPEEDRIEMFLDGALPETEAAAVEKHLLECAGCAARYESLREADEELKKYSQPQPGEDYWRSLPEKLAARFRTGRGVAPIKTMLFTAAWRLVEIAAVFAIILAGSTVYTVKTFKGSGPHRIVDVGTQERMMSVSGGGNKNEATVFSARREMFRASKTRDEIF
jgi:anti-sigma factor RsiW